MQFRRNGLLLLAGVFLGGALGCSHPYGPPPPPPPPPVPGEGSPLVGLAERNGFEAGRADAQRALYEGRRYDPYHTRAFHNTPGFQPGMGPYPVYRDAFRSAYLRGYEHAFNRR